MFASGGWEKYFRQMVLTQIEEPFIQPYFLDTVTLEPFTEFFSVAGSGSLTNKIAWLDTYHDFIRMNEGESVEQHVRDLAVRCAGAYRVLRTNARAKGGITPVGVTIVYIPELSSSLGFSYIEPIKASISDPTQAPVAYITYTFKFAYILMEK